MIKKAVQREKKQMESEAFEVDRNVESACRDDLLKSMSTENVSLTESKIFIDENHFSVINDDQNSTDNNQEFLKDLNEDDYDILNKNDEMPETKEHIMNESADLTKINANLVESETNSDDNSSNFLDILGNGSLTKSIVHKGIENNRPRTGQICTITYTGKLEDHTVVENKENFQFILGDGDVVPAFDIGVSLMNLNEECDLCAEPRHAYDAIGNPPNIPGNSKIFYRIKLNDFVDQPEMNQLQPVERLSLAEAKKIRGNYYYNRQNFDAAVGSYKKGLKYFVDHNLSTKEVQEDLNKFNEIKLSLLMNVALSNYKLELYKDALESLDELLNHQRNHVKALFIKGKILMHTGELVESIKCFTKALEFDDKNTDISKELSKAQAKYKLQYDNEKKLYKKMIAGVSPIKDNNEIRRKLSLSKKSNDNNNAKSYFKLSYIAATGAIVLMASLGVALYSKYKSSI